MQTIKTAATHCTHFSRERRGKEEGGRDVNLTLEDVDMRESNGKWKLRNDFWSQQREIIA